ncbi:AraC family transcriptional regulator [Mycolicibacterium sp. PAM1]|uniref:AraC family transcriptional regulator n=1 Tax=Mycolicibacterium sp. PAM1 TaxID=2853535 RepID=UPI001C3E3632|nr:AraC family transcriptional regulator [Mycolicibacterium sp. PAM1]MBV5246126.1 AraC family transcriptional regulator [Mycolicibacterium sp. PAM1]
MDVLMSLLRPEAVLSKVITGAGSWGVRKPRYGDPAFCLMLEGSCVLDADGLDSIALSQGDFLLLPETPEFTLSAGREATPSFSALDHSPHTRHGDASAPVTMRMLGGYFRFDPANAALLVALLPPVIHVRGGDPDAPRLTRLVELIAEEADADGACRDAILQRLVEVLLIEAARVQSAPDLAGPHRGLITGLADPVLAPALRALHADIAHGWTVEGLARTASVSRAVFAQKFTRAMGLTPMQYLLEWRVAVAKDLMRSERLSIAQLAQRVGYQSATAFTTAFTRVAGAPPTEFARTLAPGGV